MKLYLLLLVTLHFVSLSFSQYNPLKDPYTCGLPTCESNGKFNYRPETLQDYKYSIETRSLFNGTSKNESTLYIEGTVSLTFLTPCDGLLTLSDIKLSENIPRDGSENPEHPNSQLFADMISEYSLRFSFKDGIISELCPRDEEQTWVLNFKRGILSMLHNTMVRFDLDHVTNEEDVRGWCPTTYTVVGAKETSLIIGKTKDLSRCTNYAKLHSLVQSTPIFNFPTKTQKEDIFKSTSECAVSIDHNIYNEITCKEIYLLQPFSNQASGATTTVVQKLILKNEGKSGAVDEKNEITRRLPLNYDHLVSDKPTSSEIKTARAFVKELCKQAKHDFQIEFPELFHKFIKTLRPLSHAALSALYRHSKVTCPTGKKHLLEALPFVSTPASVALMKDIILGETLPEVTVNEWMMSMAFIAQPDEEMIKAALKLLQEKTFTSNMALSVAALTRTYCNQRHNCHETDAVREIAQYFEGYLLKATQEDTKDRIHQDNIIVALKAMSTIGLISEDFQGELFKLIQASNLDVAIRVAAVESFRRSPCDETRSYFEQIFRNQDQDAEIRIAAYLQVMRCPNYLLIRTIRQTLKDEQVNQVGAFVWSHLNNILKTSNPSRVEIQSLLSEKDLVKKFDTDIRKFSHNREGSLYFDEYNFGGNYESNVIFSPSSYIPRAAMLNLTVDLFGESVNLLEIYGRMEGFEHYLESFFGPKGKSNIIKDKMEKLKMRWTRNTKQNEMIENEIDKLPNPLEENNINEPKVAVGLKVFGNDIKYATVCGDEEIQEALRTLNPANYLKRILSGKEINYNKAAMFLDSSYVVPSGTGLPLSLAVIGTASINIKLYGSLKSAGLSKSKEFDLAANIEPAVSLDITGEMSLDAFYASTGIKLKTNLYTATAVNGDIKIRGTKLLSVKFSLPKQNTKIFGARSELLVKQNDVDRPQKGLVSSEVANSICSWPVVDQTVGLKLCTDYSFINASKINDAPYFILAGPALFQCYINRSDPTASTYLFEYKWTHSKELSVISLTFDTPGSTIKRLLNANLTIDRESQNLTLLLQSTAGTVLARGRYKNTEDEKFVQVTLDINNKKHLEASMSNVRQKKLNGYIYKPKVYLGVNGIRVLELQGTVDLISKNDVSQYTVDLKFQTKRLTSKIFGYISKTETSLGTDLYLDYKFQNTKEHRLSLKFSIANRSRKNMAIIIGSCAVNSTAYPNFNFNSTVTFQRSGSHMEFKMGLIQNPLSPDDRNAEFASLKFDLLFSYKSFTDSKRTIKAVAGIKRKSSNLDLKGEVLYESINSDINVECNINYGNNKQIVVSVFWSHPRTTLEQIKAHVNVTVPTFSPMVLKVEISETHNRDYKVDISGTWFSGHSAHAVGFYQDKSTIRSSNHHLKVFIKSPNFKDIRADLQFYRDNNILKLDLKAFHDDQDYQLFINHNTTSADETKTQGKIKYKTEVYSLSTSVYTGDYIKVLAELHIDKLRDIDFAIWIYNQESQKALGFDINWDANRDPNQKLLVALNLTKSEDFNYNADLTIGYPGRTIIGKYHFLLEKGHIDTLATISWDDGKSFAATLDLIYSYENKIFIEMNLRINTPFDNWKNVKLFGTFEHAANKYSLDGKLSWDVREKVALSLFGDYTALGSYFTCKYSCWITSSLDRIPNINTTIQHTQNETTCNTNVYLMYNPEFVINVDSKWKVDANEKYTNLTGTVHSQTPFKGLTKGLLISKIYFTNNKYLRGVADLDLDHRKMVVNMEGKLQKLMDSMLVINATTPDEKYQIRFILSKEKRHFVALVTYPTGNLGTEVLFNVHNFSNFDVKLFLATPVEFLQDFIVVAKYVPEQADFRLGWNFLLLGFSGVWHYANVIDFEYSYKIYTPIKDFEENGIVGKLIYKEGLDFEASIKLSFYKLGVKLMGKPKPKILKELGINIKDFYAQSRIMQGEKSDDPLSWEGLIELDAIIYPTIKGTLEVDQKGPAYILQSKLFLPHGIATVFDEFEFIDILSMKNELKIITPYPVFKSIDSNFQLNIIHSELYVFGLNLHYTNRSEVVKTGVFAAYHVDRRELEERIYNVTLQVNTPFKAFPKLNLFGAFETEENFYHTKLLFNTNSSDISLDATTEIDGNWLKLTSDVHLKTPIINIPQCQLRLTKLFPEFDNNYVELIIKVPERFKSDIYFRTSWLAKSPRYKATLHLETPFVGMENTTAGFDTYLSREKSTMWLLVQVHPLEIEANSTLVDDFFQSVSLLQFSGKQFPVTIDCHILRLSKDQRQFNGGLTIKDRMFNISGRANLMGDLPVKLLITLTPRDNGHPLTFQYNLTETLKGFELDGFMQNADKVTRFTANATTNDKFNWDFNLKVNPPKATQKIMVFAKAVSDPSSYKLDITGISQIPKLESPKCGIKYSPRGVLHSAYGYFEVTEAKGSVTIDVIWQFLENMYVNVIGKYQNLEYASQSKILAFYENPQKLLHLLKVGGDIKIDTLWQSAANATIKLPENKTVSIEGHFKVPNDARETHSLYGNFAYGDRFSFVDYLLKYRCTLPLRKYGTWAKVLMEDKKNFSANAALEWDGREYHNYGNLRKFNKTLNVVYKLKTPKFSNKHLFVTDINYNQLENHHNLTCELFSPENHSVAFVTVDYVELANMEGKLNISVPYQAINHTGAYFQTKTNEQAYNRYIRVFWDNDTAILDSKCNIKTGNTLLESNTKGKLIAELPLASRHIAIIDYEYNKHAHISTGYATVKYNNSNVLDAKYNCLSESKPDFSKDTIHIELLNKMVPLGADYIHSHELKNVEKSSGPILDSRSLNLYHLENRSNFNVTGELHQESTDYGQKYLLRATHSNRTVKLWMDYALVTQKYNQHTRLELSPTTWIEYDLNIVNKTQDEVFDAQLILINVSYPRRNFSAEGFYNISDSIVLTDVSLVWDKDNKTVQAGLDWRRASPHREQLQFQIKHPTFERDVTFLTEYGYDNSSLDGHLSVDYSLDPDKRLTLGAKVQDVSDIKTYNYTYSIWAEHNATSLYLSSFGDIYWNPNRCGSEHITDYKRSYLSLTRSEAFAKLNFNENEIEFKKHSLTGFSYFWGKYAGKFPVYTANMSAAHSINHTSGKFYLNFRKKLLYLDVNMTEDGSQSLHTYGIIPDARSIQFDIWRDYEDKRVSDVSYYLKLNHSRLIMSSLRWRPQLISNVQNEVRSRAMELYQGVLEEINNTRQYVRAESLDGLDGIWQDAKPFVENFLLDLRNITVIEEDFDVLKEFLNNSYNANEFYIKDISTVLLSMFDELSLNSHLQSLPKIIKEIWDVMGESGEKIKKSINFVIEKIKSYYKSTTQFIHDLINGDPVKQLSSILEKLVEKYDTFIKNLHVAVLQYMERLWAQTYDLVVENWHKTLEALEPTFLKFIHYLETMVWSTGKEFLDFLYIRKNKIIESAYFMEFAKFSKDFDRFYKDVTGNNTIEAIYKYSNVAWSFFQEKYLNHIPFGKELQAVLLEIWNELKQLGEIPSIRYLISIYNELEGYIKYYYKYFEVDNRIHRFIRLIYTKISDMSVTAIEVENRQREAKTKFVFEPHDGVMLLEQKLPMSWHAFNETPKLQEIPEVKMFYDIHSYLTASTASFWNFYYNYKPYTDPSDWLPPFRGHAMWMGSTNYVTFDKSYYNFDGSCTYLLATDFIDRNFTLVSSFDHEAGTNELILLLKGTMVRINPFKNSIKIGDDGIQRLPVEIGDTFIYLDAGILRAESFSGFILECNMKFHICIFEISGWYFGKTAGLWGTYNNEPFDDFLSSDKKRLNLTDFNDFADSWTLDQDCETTEISTRTPPFSKSKEIILMCEEFYNSKVSHLSTCFSRIPKDQFLDMCLTSSTPKEACGSVVSYISLCSYENTPIRIPDTCVKCNLLNGTEIQEGDFVRLQGNAVPKTADIVFIVEAKECNKNLKLSKNINILVDLINQELTEAQVADNRYAVVVFGGDGVYDLPRSIVFNGNTFTDANSILNYFTNIPVGDGNNDIYNSIIFATQLLFRPGASRNFILLPCSECQEYNMEHDYSILHQLLFENAVSLHILMNDSFSLQAGEARKRENKIPFGIDLQKAYTKKDIKSLVGDHVLRSSISLPKSSLGLCLSLALETNGTVFTATHLESQKNAKKIATVFAKRFALSALPTECTDCECTAGNTGVSYMECYPCIYPRPNFNIEHSYYDDDDE